MRHLASSSVANDHPKYFLQTWRIHRAHFHHCHHDPHHFSPHHSQKITHNSHAQVQFLAQNQTRLSYTCIFCPHLASSRWCVLLSDEPRMLNMSLQVFKHHNIKYVAIHESSRQQERITNLEAFKNSGHNGLRVLLLSSVSAIGLNIAFANILIIVVCIVSVKHVIWVHNTDVWWSC